jgi:hypothetical protein
MSQFEFLRYDETPKEKYLGVVTVKIEGKYIQRFKVQKNTKGGYWIVPPSIKMDSEDGDVYLPCFMMDSNFAKEELDAMMRKAIKPYLAGESPSVVAATTPLVQGAVPSALQDADLPF